jgi:hypothetical protein
MPQGKPEKGPSQPVVVDGHAFSGKPWQKQGRRNVQFRHICIVEQSGTCDAFEPVKAGSGAFLRGDK